MGIKHDKVMIKCALDDDECIDLLTILRVINQVSLDQAWAICYEICDLMQRLPPSNCAIIDSLDQIHLHKDGFVHQKSLLLPRSPSQTSSKPALPTTINNNKAPNLLATTRTPQTLHPTIQQQTPVTIINNNTSPHHMQPLTSPPTPPITPELSELLGRRPASNESELVESLGIALFWALDYGIPDDEERKLGKAMELFIIQAHQSKMSLNEVLESCINRLPIATKAYADSHYKSVCKSLISDTIELSMFLEKIYTASMVLSDITLDSCLETNHRCDIGDKHLGELGEPLASLRALRFNDWARLWMQVIRELRQRGKFKQALLVN